MTASILSGAGWAVIGIILGVGVIAATRIVMRDPYVRKVRFGFFWEREREEEEHDERRD
jgi:hypothetical protein